MAQHTAMDMSKPSYAAALLFDYGDCVIE